MHAPELQDETSSLSSAPSTSILTGAGDARFGEAASMRAGRRRDGVKSVLRLSTHTRPACEKVEWREGEGEREGLERTVKRTRLAALNLNHFPLALLALARRADPLNPQHAALDHLARLARVVAVVVRRRRADVRVGQRARTGEKPERVARQAVCGRALLGLLAWVSERARTRGGSARGKGGRGTVEEDDNARLLRRATCPKSSSPSSLSTTIASVLRRPAAPPPPPAPPSSSSLDAPILNGSPLALVLPPLRPPARARAPPTPSPLALFLLPASSAAPRLTPDAPAGGRPGLKSSSESGERGTGGP